MEEAQITIVGAGPVGLTISMLLSRRGIPSVLIEKRSSVSNLPRARGVNQRSMEIWSQLGLQDELAAMSLPPEWCRRFLYMDTLDGQIIGEMPSNSMLPGANAQFTTQDFRCTSSDQIEAMLLRHARTYPPAQIRFNQELIDFEQDARGVTLTIEDRADGGRKQLRTQFLLAADGGSSRVRERAAIASIGAFNLKSYVNTHFRADLSRWTRGREAALIWILAQGVEGVFQALDGKQRWMSQIQLGPQDDPQDSWSPERVMARLRDMIGPQGREVQIELYSAHNYTISSLVAERLREGRVLLIGDAAHKIPPFGSIGMNTGVQAAHNLVWKLVAVLCGAAPFSIFDSYDVERREVAKRVCTVGRLNKGYVDAIQAAQTLEAKRAAVASSTSYGNWVGLDLGVHYEEAGAFVSDDTPPPPVSDPVTQYIPTAKPGYRAPHFWLRRGAERMSSVDLFQRDFVVLTGANGHAWIKAVREIGPQGDLGLVGYRVGPAGDLVPESADFTALYGIDEWGAVLVRPDGHVAFRSRSQPADPMRSLRAALRTVLGRS
jgi:2-polyprenyl-6-methoxyphenol hydroxylase-like FAD-dependent oxidoreductase